MAEPVIKFDTQGKAAVISYNVPEPTSYSGKNVIELVFPDEYFTPIAKKVPEKERLSGTGSTAKVPTIKTLSGIKLNLKSATVAAKSSAATTTTTTAGGK